MITFEIRNIENPDEVEIEVFLDERGLDALIDELEYLKKNGGHIHLMTPGWAGNELSEVRFRKESTLLNHVRIVLVEPGLIPEAPA